MDGWLEVIPVFGVGVICTVDDLFCEMFYADTIIKC